jgi:hypothetical protein
MWVALAVDGFIFLCRMFEQDDGTNQTSLLVDSALGLIPFSERKGYRLDNRLDKNR